MLFQVYTPLSFFRICNKKRKLYLSLFSFSKNKNHRNLERDAIGMAQQEKELFFP
jgi:hypothetical protein